MQKVKVGVSAMEPLEPVRLAGGQELVEGINGVSADDFDDRVMCEDCQAYGSKTVVQRFTSDQFEKIRKINHPAFRWMFDVMVIQDDWRVVKYQENICKKNSTLILSVKHRCYMFKPKVEVGSDNWIEDLKENLSENLTDNKNIEKTKVGSDHAAHRTHRAGEAGHVAESVLPRPDGGSNTEWWD